MKGIGLTKKRAISGFLFTLPFCIGFFIFSLRPLIQSLIFTFSKTSPDPEVGYLSEFSGLDNLNYILRVDPDYLENLLASLRDLSWQVPVIIVASLFFASLLNQKFFGRTLIRAIFFLPVIIASGLIIQIIQNDVVASSVLSGNVVSAGTVQKSSQLQDIFIQMNLSEDFIRYFTTITSGLFTIIWQTGIQIIIFLAGLQSIPSSLYEASAIEGSTAWEDFWKITIPMLLPIILVNTIFTIVDSFTSINNIVVRQISVNRELLRYGWSSAMSWVYFVIIGIVISLVMLLFAKTNSTKEKGRR